MITFQQFVAHVRKVREALRQRNNGHEAIQQHKALLRDLMAKEEGIPTKVKDVAEDRLWPLYQELVKAEKANNLQPEGR